MNLASWSTLTRIAKKLAAVSILVFTIAGQTLPFDVQAQSASQPQRIDAKGVVSRLADSLTEGARSVAGRFKALGIVHNASWIDERVDGGFNPAAFSGRTLIEHAYLSAEKGTEGDGRRLLAALRADAATRSAALATDPSLSFLSGYSDADLKKPFIFATIEAADTLPRLTPAVESAIGILAEHLANGNLGQFRLYAQRHFLNPKFTAERFDVILHEASSETDAIVRMFAEGLPPPTAQKASLGLFW
jgi:hypothetical protein